MYQASITLEHQTQPPKTLKCAIDCRSPAAAVAKAVRAAKKTFKRAAWVSLVVVLEKPPKAER